MSGEDRANQGDSTEPESAGKWGCTVAAFVGLLGIVLGFRWSAAIGVALVVVSFVLVWRTAKRFNEIAEARRARKAAGHGALVGDVWRRLFAAEGLGDIVDRAAPLVRAAVRVSTTRVAAVALGASRIGGAPDLPMGVHWPRHGGVPLAFLAQFDLRNVAEVEPMSPLPRTGHLWFFLDTKRYWSESSGRESGAIVLYDAGDSALVSTEPPADLPGKSRFPLCAVTLEAYEDLPDPENEPWLSEWLDEDEARRDAYYDVRSELESGIRRDPHKLLGYAGAIQSSMELECELGARGIPFANRTQESEAAARDWRLLFQVESDGNAGMLWGDAGRLYFWIRDADLRAARFERTRVVFQCH